MADYTELKNDIRSNIKQNGRQEITGNILQQQMIDMVDQINEGVAKDIEQIAKDGSGSPLIKGETGDNAMFEADNSTRGKCSLNAGWESTIEGTASLVSGYRNTVKSSYSRAEGSNNYIGLRGAYIKFLNKKETGLFVTEWKIQRGLDGDWTEEESEEFISRLGFKVNDIISIITDVTYENCARITGVDGNRLAITMLNGVTIDRNLAEDTGSSRYCLVYSLDNPEAGVVEMAKQSYVEGELNTIKSDDCHVEGRENTAIAPNCHVEGRNNTSSGSYNHVEGRDNSAEGSYNHVEGRGNKAKNAVEHAEGRYNRSNTGTIHSVGVGSSNNDRKNAFEIMNDGACHMKGVGSYNGTNPTASNSLQTIINNKAEKSDLPTATILQYLLNPIECYPYSIMPKACLTEKDDKLYFDLNKVPRGCFVGGYYNGAYYHPQFELQDNGLWKLKLNGKTCSIDDEIYEIVYPY